MGKLIGCLLSNGVYCMDMLNKDISAQV